MKIGFLASWKQKNGIVEGTKGNCGLKGLESATEPTQTRNSRGFERV